MSNHVEFRECGQPHLPSHSHTLFLQGGGTVTISAKVCPFSLSEEDRAYLASLFSEIRRYDEEKMWMRRYLERTGGT